MALTGVLQLIGNIGKDAGKAKDQFADGKWRAEGKGLLISSVATCLSLGMMLFQNKDIPDPMARIKPWLDEIKATTYEVLKTKRGMAGLNKW